MLRERRAGPHTDEAGVRCVRERAGVEVDQLHAQSRSGLPRGGNDQARDELADAGRRQIDQRRQLREERSVALARLERADEAIARGVRRRHRHRRGGARLDRADRDADLGPDLARAHTEEVRQLEHVPLLGRELAQRAAEGDAIGGERRSRADTGTCASGVSVTTVRLRAVERTRSTARLRIRSISQVEPRGARRGCGHRPRASRASTRRRARSSRRDHRAPSDRRDRRRPDRHRRARPRPQI